MFTSRGRLAVLVLGLAAAAAPALAAEHRVVIDAMAFTPQVVQARPGDTITWVNKDMFVHDVTIAGSARSGQLAPGQSWRYTVAANASFDYVCSLHPTMKGRVQAAGARAAAHRVRSRP